MNFIKFRHSFAAYPIFSLEDVRKIDPKFNRIQLSRWAKKGYIKRIKKTFYHFEEQILDRDSLFYAANKIYSPSYISLESAFQYYQLTEDCPAEITSVSPKKTAKFQNFAYKHLSQNLYFGHRLVGEFRMAEVEKALLDYLYFHPELETAELQIDYERLAEILDKDKFQHYLGFFGNKKLKERAERLLATAE